ncbi:multidrug effflux MFS transporter [Flavivirga spongiicola]|uniref:Multidrug effflux MFS transporter n=1 Tax=Flavivirga spongiicola TaxID=421621 RepID=A0ABU7XQC7_9FLAO|nr:multidrug effflux MFS transporter [Flavivirga sp. MEBiC05379]MDO5977976.1 multidrug effflux MFS transporter [Flavivirga sp. MEBiC05379]
MKNRELGFIEFIILVALLMALVSVTINMLLPAFQDILNDFQLKDKNKIQLTVSLLYLGLGFSQLFYGTLSDTIGRKPSIYHGLILFLLGCIISYVSNNLSILLIGQVLQGIGLGAPRVISVAIVRDKFEGRRMARAMSFIMVIYVLMPIVSPILGKSIIMISNWRILFIIYIGLGILVFLLFKYRMPETLAPDKQKSFSLKHLFKATQEILSNKYSFTYILILGLYSGVFITYLNLSQAIFEFQYQLGNQYPYYFAFLACSIGLALFINGKLVLSLGMKLLTEIAILSSLFTAILFFSISYFIQPSLWLFIVFMFVQLFSYGLLVGNLNALAMQPLGHIAGLGASVVGAISTIISVPMSIFIGSFYNNTTSPIVIAYCFIGTMSLLMLNFINQQFSYGKLNR